MAAVMVWPSVHSRSWASAHSGEASTPLTSPISMPVDCPRPKAAAYSSSFLMPVSRPTS